MAAAWNACLWALGVACGVMSDARGDEPGGIVVDVAWFCAS
jgi:hypothetical protein